MRIVYTKAAQQDLVSLLNFILDDSPNNATLVLERLEEQIRLLTTQPEMGRPGRVPHTRELVILKTPFIIPYQVKNNTLIILRVYHVTQRWPESG